MSSIDMASAADSLYGSPAPTAAPAAPAPAAPPPAPMAQIAGRHADAIEARHAQQVAQLRQVAQSSLDLETQPVQQQAPQAQPRLTTEQMLALIERNRPASINEARSSTERQLYSGDATYADVLPDAAFEHPNLDPDVSQALARETRAMMGDLGFTSTEARSFIDAIARHDWANAAANAPAMRHAAAQALEQEFGVHAHEALQAARQLVARDPRLTNFLNRSGLGNSPQVALQLARAAMRSRGAV